MDFVKIKRPPRKLLGGLQLFQEPISLRRQRNPCVPARGTTNQISVVANSDLKSVRISDAEAFETFHAVGEDVRNLTQRTQLPGAHREEEAGLRRAGPVSQHGDFAVGALEGDTFESDFDFIVLDLNILNLGAEGVDKGRVGGEVHDREVRLAAFSVEESESVGNAFLNRVVRGIVPDTGETRRVRGAIHVPEGRAGRVRSRDPGAETGQAQERARGRRT